MASRKRPRTENHDPPLPTLPSPSQAKSSRVKTSTRQTISSRPTRSTPARGKSSVVPTPTETPSITTSDHHDDDSRDASDAGNSHGSSYTLKGIMLVREALKIANNANSAEYMILKLMGKYSFSLPHFKDLLSGKPVMPFPITSSQRLINFQKITSRSAFLKSSIVTSLRW